MPAGRNPIEFDLDQVELFGYFRATYQTMADWFGVNKDTINERMQDEGGEFSVRYKKGFSDMKMKLSEAQIRNAIDNNNPSLQIWLGKQHLDQKDKQELDQSITISKTADEMTNDELAAIASGSNPTRQT